MIHFDRWMAEAVRNWGLCADVLSATMPSRLLAGLEAVAWTNLVREAGEYQRGIVRVMAVTGWSAEEAEREFNQFYGRLFFTPRLTALQEFTDMLTERRIGPLWE